MNLARTGRILVFGGCYSNLQATEALLATARRLGIDPRDMFCTGDIIAYGADAAATLALIRESGITSIAGNCEAQLAVAAPDCGCGFAPGSACDALAVAWFTHASAQVSAADRAYMAGLPAQLTIRLDGCTLRLVHGNAERTNAFVFPSASSFELTRQIALAGTDAVIAGHAGIPFTRHLPAGLWHNTGSIGMPANDGTARGWFSLVEVVDGALRIESHPLIYDARSAAAAMRAAKLPEGYAAALETGLWPSLDILPAPERLRTGIALEHAAPAAPAPRQPLETFATLWVNTGTLCNIACRHCFMESSPTNDALAYFTPADLAAVLAQAPAGLAEIGYTGGEPFMNPHIMALLTAALETGRRAVVLTNAMRPLRRHDAALAALAQRFPGQLALRVSLDHFDPVRHEELRGPNTFAPAIEGLQHLATLPITLSVAARTPWGDTETMLRAGFQNLFDTAGVALNAWDETDLVLFPEMDTNAPAPPVTSGALHALDRPPMCATSRMAVRRRGEGKPDWTPCTLLPHRTLTDYAMPIDLDHPHCARFCVYGEGNCKG